MCGMCGIWGSTMHWSSPAQLFKNSDREINIPRTRLLQASGISRFTRLIGVNVRDWGQSTWIVEHLSGASEIVNSLPEIWGAAARLSGREIDLLQPETIRRLEGISKTYG